LPLTNRYQSLLRFLLTSSDGASVVCVFARNL
jgi:hypothetical protein